MDNWRWAGVPFYIRTGKRLPKRVTEVALQFQRPPHLPIRLDQATALPDALILRIQPDEGITLRFGAKVPGHSFVVRSATMEFNYEATFVEESPEAYERLLLDALIGDPTLFIRSDEVAQCWRIIDPIIGYWADDARSIPLYEAASGAPPKPAACSNATAARGETPKSEHRGDRMSTNSTDSLLAGLSDGRRDPTRVWRRATRPDPCPIAPTVRRAGYQPGGGCPGVGSAGEADLGYGLPREDGDTLWTTARTSERGAPGPAGHNASMYRLQRRGVAHSSNLRQKPSGRASA